MPENAGTGRTSPRKDGNNPEKTIKQKSRKEALEKPETMSSKKELLPSDVITSRDCSSLFLFFIVQDSRASLNYFKIFLKYDLLALQEQKI